MDFAAFEFFQSKENFADTDDPEFGGKGMPDLVGLDDVVARGGHPDSPGLVGAEWVLPS